MTSQRSGTLAGTAGADTADAYSESGSVASSAAATPRASSGVPYDPHSSTSVRAVLAANASRGADGPALSAAQAQLAALREERERLAAQNAQLEAALAATRADLEAAQATARDLHSRATVAEESKSAASQVGAGCLAPHRCRLQPSSAAQVAGTADPRVYPPALFTLPARSCRPCSI